MTEKPKPEIDLVEQLAPDGFIMIRSGIREHIDGGRFLGFDLGVYLYLHAISSWKTGIAYTCAKAIGEKLEVPARSVNNSLYRMRERGYINYPKGDGSRGLYCVYIHKARPTVGALRGYELDAFWDNDFQEILYRKADGGCAVAAWKPRCEGAEVALMRRGDGVLVARIQDGKDGKAGQDVARRASSSTAKKRVSELVSEAKRNSNPAKPEVPCLSCGASHDTTYGDLCADCYDREMSLCDCGQPSMGGTGICPDCGHPKCKKCGVDINAYDCDDLCPQCKGKETCAHGKPLEHGRCACPAFETECDECGQSHPNLPCTHKRVPKPCSFCRDPNAETVPYEAETDRWICLECSNGGNYGD